MGPTIARLALAFLLPAVCLGGISGSPPSVVVPGDHGSRGFGDLCTVGGAAYLNLSLLGVEHLEHVMDLPRCLHEDATWKEREGWKLSVRDKKVQRKLRAKAKREPLSVSAPGGRGGGRVAFAPIPSPATLLRPTSASAASRAPALAGVSMLLGRGAQQRGAAAGSLGPLPGMGRAEAAPVLLSPAAGWGGVAVAAGKGFGLVPKGNSTKTEGGRGVSGLRKDRGDGKPPVREVEMQFTCNKCDTRQSKKFTRMAYEKGVVIVVCEGCDAKHLIADNIGWYKDWTGEAGGTNVEAMMAAKGMSVDNRLGDWDPEDESAGAVQPLTPDGQPIVMKRRDDGTFEAVGEDEEEG